MTTGNQPLKVMDFGLVVSDKKLRAHGFKFGDEVLVTAFKQVQESAKDPYLTRSYVIAAKVENDVVQIPAENNDYKVYVIDPRALSGVSSQRDSELHAAIKSQYGR